MAHQLFAGEDHAAKYRAYRPNYPKQLFDHIIDYYFDGKTTNEKIPLALDVACGSGQATVDLSLLCERVIGIDVSESQIANAIPKDNIEYRCNSGEDLSFLQSNSIDLITIATSLHWLDIEKFFKEVKRVLKPHTGVLAIWTYKFSSLDNPIAQEILHDFFYVKLFPYRNEKQDLVQDFYQSLIPIFPYQSTLRQYIIERQFESVPITGFVGSVETASVCQTYKRQTSEQEYQETFNTLRQKLIQCYAKKEIDNNNEQTIDGDSIKITVSNPIRLYLMKKNEI